MAIQPVAPCRVVIWGPGEVGAGVLRAALDNPAFEVVGAKVRSAAKHGADIGDLAGVGAVGVRATTDRDEVIALKPDCVVVTPSPAAVLRGLDDDVIALLESGANVVSTAAYHNVSMSNWLSVFRQPPERILQACQRGGATLLGTGVHPTFLVERLAMTMASAMSAVTHVRSVEAVDFSRAPATMWGGLSALGFGTEVDSLGPESQVARGGDLYYGDLTGNVAHALYGVGNDKVEVRTALRGLPAPHDITIGPTTIAAGTAAALHLTHRGYLDGRHYFTNEECWYLAPDVVYRGDDLPFGGFREAISYTLVISGEPAEMRAQLEFGFSHSRVSPITYASVRAVLDAIPAVCAAEPGILIDDPTPAYRHDPRLVPA